MKENLKILQNILGTKQSLSGAWIVQKLELSVSVGTGRR